MRFLFSVLFAVFSIINVNAQLAIHIKDEDTKLPLPFATAECLQKHWGMYADSAGKLIIPDTVFQTCPVTFTCIGYKTLQSKISTPDSAVYLKKQVHQLAAVFIKNCNDKKTVKLQDRDKRSHHSLGFTVNAPGFILASHISNPYNTRGIAKTISYGVADFFHGHKLDAPARLHFYEWDSLLNMPGEEITDNIIELIPGKTGWITTDISAFNIHIPASGFVIGFEMFDAGRQYHFESIVNDNKVKKTIQCYGWGLEARENNMCGGYYKSPGKSWTEHREPLAAGLAMDLCIN